MLTRSVFQAGFSWQVIGKKWPGFLRAFDGFDVDSVAAYGPADMDRLVADAGIVRNARKITATIANAAAIQEIRGRHGSVAAWLAGSRSLGWPERKTVVAEPFTGLGPAGAYFFLWSVGEPTPPHELEAGWSAPAPPGSGLVEP